MQRVEQVVIQFMIKVTSQSFFTSLTHFIFRYSKQISFLIFSFLVVFVFQITKLQVDTSIDGFLHQNDPALITYNQFQQEYGQDVDIILLIESESVLNEPFLEKLRKLHQEIEAQVPYLDEVTSLYNIRSVDVIGDTLNVDPLIGDKNIHAIINDVRQSIQNIPFFTGYLISADRRLATIIIKTRIYKEIDNDQAMAFFEGEESSPSKITAENILETLQALVTLRKQYDEPSFEVTLAGSPYAEYILGNAIQKESLKFTTLAIIVIAIFLLIIYRRLAGVLIPLVVVLAAVLCSFSAMALLEIPIKILSQVLPSFLLAVGCAGCIHLLTSFFHNYDKGLDKEEAIVIALHETGVPIFLTAITTIAGLLSFSGAQFAPVAELGIVAAIGLIFLLFFTLIGVPLAIAILPLKARACKQKKQLIEKYLMKIVNKAFEAKAFLIVIGFVIVAASINGLSNIMYEHNFVKWMPDDWELKKAIETIDQKLGGAHNMEVLIDLKQNNAFKNKEQMEKLNSLINDINAIRINNTKVGNVRSYFDLLKETNSILHGGSKEFYRIPDSTHEAAQALLLIEIGGTDELLRYVDPTYQRTRLTISMPTVDASTIVLFKKEIERKLQQYFGSQVDYQITGVAALLSKVMTATIDDMITCYSIAFISISVLMIIVLSNLKLGLISMVPNITPILIVMGLMGYLKIPFDMSTMLLGTIILGLVVDDTIHFLHAFKMGSKHQASFQNALQYSIQSAGVSICITSLILSAGFFVFTIGELQNIFWYGLLTGITILVALIVELIYTPFCLFFISDRTEKQLTSPN